MTCTCKLQKKSTCTVNERYSEKIEDATNKLPVQTESEDPVYRERT